MKQYHIAEIEKCRRLGKTDGAAVTLRLLTAEAGAGHFHAGSIPYIHVAGTNGKGSVCAMLASVLTAAGYRTGLYTSPHLTHFTERIQTDGCSIPRSHADLLAGRVLAAARSHGIEGSMFDYATVMAAEYFEEEHCRMAIIETGLGGTLDATNSLGIPEICVITPIGMDHMQLLGHTIEEIAAAKAGIIKTGVPAVTGQQLPAAMQVIQDRCAKTASPLFTAASYAGQPFPYKLSLSGAYQTENAAIVLKVIDVLRQKGYNISVAAVSRGLSETRWPGRFQLIRSDGTRPDMIIDGAHNSHGAIALHDSLMAAFPGRKIHFLMGVLSDKDYRDMVAAISDLACEIDTVTPDSSRALDAGTLSSVIIASGLPSHCYSDTVSAFDAVVHADREIPVCIFGSLYFIGEIEEHIKKEAVNVKN